MTEYLEPTADRLIVKPIEADRQSAGGVVLPDVAQERPHRGMVERRGPDVTGIVEDDTIIYSKYGGTEVALDNGETRMVLRMADVLAIVREHV